MREFPLAYSWRGDVNWSSGRDFPKKCPSAFGTGIYHVPVFGFVRIIDGVDNISFFFHTIIDAILLNVGDNRRAFYRM